MTAGRPLVEVVKLAFAADIPLLLHGNHGVGKSALLEHAAHELGVDLIVRDLALMEPTDLVGIPYRDDNDRTRFAPPSFLPRPGSKGLLVFEELNRAPRYMQSSCLQLLSARRLNDYELVDWLPCAAVNPADSGGYTVEPLDPALLSRFLQVHVVADVEQWCAWARTDGKVHPKIIDFVRRSQSVFAETSPRSWVFASRVLEAWERNGGGRPEPLITALAGVLATKWATAFSRAYLDADRPLDPGEVLDAYATHREAMRRWGATGRLDLIASTLTSTIRFLSTPKVFEQVLGDPTRKMNLEKFLDDLTPDFRTQVRTWLAERGFKGIVVRDGALV
ncbi:MAG: AAA family ATPase [Deltaproteobacteria bacterium]|nr:AAA family ATPase [Deltaproteobacteria bacterium]